MLILINKKSNGSVQTNWAIIEDIADIRYIVLHRCKIDPLLRVLCHVFANVTCYISNTAPRLWNDLPPEFRTFSVPQPSSPITHPHLHQAPLSITAKAFHSKQKSLLFKNSYPDSTDHLPSNSRPKRHPP